MLNSLQVCCLAFSQVSADVPLLVRFDRNPSQSALWSDSTDSLAGKAQLPRHRLGKNGGQLLTYQWITFLLCSQDSFSVLSGTHVHDKQNKLYG